MPNTETLKQEISSILDASEYADASEFESKIIIADLMGLEPSELPLHAADAVPEDIYEKALEIAKKRVAGEPLQYLLGKWEFMSLPFYVGPGVFIPGPDTERLAETAIYYCLNQAKDNGKVRVLDLCSGSGCVGISISNCCQNAEVTLVELYGEAFEYLKKNIELSGNERCTAVQADALTYVPEEKFDIVVSNPPYIAINEYDTLPKDVTAQPRTALTDEGDGLEYYRVITANAKNYLKEGGMLAFEIGYNQYEAVTEILSECGMKHIHHRCDYSGLRRVLISYL